MLNNAVFILKKKSVLFHVLSMSYRKKIFRKIRLRGTVTRAINREAVGTTKSVLANPEWKPGQRVKHHKFGYGSIINVEGSDKNCRLQIAFQKSRHKMADCPLGKFRKIVIHMKLFAL